MIVILTAGVYGCSKKSEDISNYETVLLAKTIEYKGEEDIDIWEIHKSLDGSELYTVNNGEVVSSKDIRNNRYDDVKIMDTIDLDDIGSVDISEKEQLTYNTWELKSEEAFGYVKHLIENEGYELIFEGISSDYIEIYLIKNEYNIIKRVIITKDTLTISSDIEYNKEDIKFETVENYVDGGK